MVRDFLPERPSFGHKGTFGTCQIVAGTRAFTGAAYLAGKAGYRAGCGLVDIASLPIVHKCLAGTLVEAVWTILPEDSEGYAPLAAEILEGKLQHADSLILGPGFGLAESTKAFVYQLLERTPDKCPVLIDADGLKLLSRHERWWEKLPENAILTPHPGEMAVLTGLTVDEIQADRWGAASQFAQKWGVTLILKGAMTVVATGKGNLFINPISDPSLATAGSGDVLSGLIGGLLAQGVSPKAASIAGVWLHSQAGIMAGKRLGTATSVTAVDILDCIAEVIGSMNHSK
jgi:NAD(P)H-hydrate epimerase